MSVFEAIRITPNTDSFYAVIVMIEKWKSAIDKGAFFSAPLTVLSKVFDCLLHEVSLAKFQGRNQGGQRVPFPISAFWKLNKNPETSS